MTLGSVSVSATGAVSVTGAAAGAVGTVGLRGAMVLPSLVDVTRDTKPSVILGQITWDSPCNFFFGGVSNNFLPLT